MSNTCAGCARALADAYLCRSCTDKLRTALHELPDLIDELVTTAYRQDRIVAPGAGRGNGERPMPFKVYAARLLAEVRHRLWINCNDTYGLPTDNRICRTLLAELGGRTKTDPHVGGLMPLIEDVTRIRVAIDLPQTHRYLGQCDHCAAELYANRDATTWPCPNAECDQTYDVAARMDDLIERARNVTAPTSTIVTALTSLEFPVTEEAIRKWKQRGLLTPRTMIGRHPGYRVGDVIDLVLSQRERQAGRTCRT